MSQFYLQQSGNSNNAVLQLTPDVGAAVVPTVGNINVFGLNGIVTSNGGVSTLNITGGVGLLQTNSVTLTSAQVKNLKSVPQTIIPAKGVGTIILPYCYNFKLNYGGTTPFVANAGGADFDYYDGASFFLITMGALQPVFVTSTATMYQANATPLTGGVTFLPTQIENLPIVLHIPPADVDISGNAANDITLVVNMQYVVQTL